MINFLWIIVGIFYIFYKIGEEEMGGGKEGGILLVLAIVVIVAVICLIAYLCGGIQVW